MKTATIKFEFENQKDFNLKINRIKRLVELGKKEVHEKELTLSLKKNQDQKHGHIIREIRHEIINGVECVVIPSRLNFK